MAWRSTILLGKFSRSLVGLLVNLTNSDSSSVDHQRNVAQFDHKRQCDSVGRQWYSSSEKARQM